KTPSRSAVASLSALAGVLLGEPASITSSQQGFVMAITKCSIPQQVVNRITPRREVLRQCGRTATDGPTLAWVEPPNVPKSLVAGPFDLDVTGITAPPRG